MAGLARCCLDISFKDRTRATWAGGSNEGGRYIKGGSGTRAGHILVADGMDVGRERVEHKPGVDRGRREGGIYQSLPKTREIYNNDKISIASQRQTDLTQCDTGV